MIKLTKVNSSQLFSRGYNPDRNEMAIRFHPKKGSDLPGEVYHYHGVTPEFYDKFLAAESVGSFFINEIKKHPDLYPYQKVDRSEYADSDDIKPDVSQQDEVVTDVQP